MSESAVLTQEAAVERAKKLLRTTYLGEDAKVEIPAHANVALASGWAFVDAIVGFRV